MSLIFLSSITMFVTGLFLYSQKIPNSKVLSAMTQRTVVSPTHLPDTKPEQRYKIYLEFMKNNHPDIYLTSFLPYNSDKFDVSYTYKNGFVYNVIFYGTIDIPSLHKWLNELGLNSSQISTLPIYYEKKESK
ncbi:MAG: hypothetical protein WCO06_02405 [Candidatus Roizmanbacteria bacterium]